MCVTFAFAAPAASNHASRAEHIETLRRLHANLGAVTGQVEN